MEAYQMKPSGVEWQGLVPTHWRRDKLFRLCNKMGSGGTPTSTNESYYGGDIPWIQSGDLTDSYVSETSKKITNEALQNSSAKMFPQGTLLVAMYGATIGKLGIMEMDAATNQACCSLQVSEKFISKFTYYLMLDIRDFLLTEAYGGGQSNISQETLKQQYMLIPKPSEQQAIADYLDQACKTINQTIEVKKKQLEKLAAYRKSVIHEAVTKGLDQDVPMKPSGVEWLGEVPEHWRVNRIKFMVSKVNSGVTPKGGSESYLSDGIPLLRSQNIKLSGLDITKAVFISEETHNKMSNSKVKYEDVLLNITGASLGRCVYVDYAGEANVNQHVCILRPYSWMSSKYLHYLLLSDVGQAQIFSSFTGSGREGLSFESIKNFTLPQVKLKEQQAIANYLDQVCNTIDQSKQVIEKQVAKLTQFRKSLIHECVTGKKRIYQGEV